MYIHIYTYIYIYFVRYLYVKFYKQDLACSKRMCTLVSTCLDKLYGFSIKEGHTYTQNIYIYIF